MRFRFVIAVLIAPALFAAPAFAARIADERAAQHVLNRLAYGPAAGELERVKKLGVDRYIEAQLNPESIALPESLESKLAAAHTLRMTPGELFAEFSPPRPKRGEKPDPEALRAARERSRVVLDQAIAARLTRAIESPRQLEEVMVDFWFNHFNVFARKGLDNLWVGAYEEQAIRPHALGRFRDLLGATAKHPAMLFYLDNWQNTAPGSPGARGRFKGLNENYARELMELHTLGVDGGYTQADVEALARILTGWGFAPRRRGAQAHGFYFDVRRHDGADKLFLGRTVRGGGVEEGEAALDQLARHTSTARHIAFKLAQYFVADEPPARLVDRLAERFRATDGDIRAVLRALFESDEFWDERYYGRKFKTPYHYVVSAVRAAGLPVNNHRLLFGALFQQGMPLYLCQTPDGYKNTEPAWLNSDAMTRRLSFATALGSGRLPLAAPSSDRVRKGAAMEAGRAMEAAMDGQFAPLDERRLAETLRMELSIETRAAIAAAPAVLRAALMLGSPEFMRR